MTVRFGFEGKLALVTGSSRGIGRAIALYLADQGCDVVVQYRRQAEAAEEVARSIRERGRRADLIQADLGVEADVTRLMDTIAERHGYLDFLIANAASTAFKTVDDTKPHNVDLTFAIVIKGLILMVQRAVRLMERRRGKIVTISGQDSIRYVPRHSTLGAAKAGLEALTRYFACEYQPRGVSVNCVLPGPVRTESLDVMARQRGSREYVEALEARAARTPMGRLGRPADVAPVVAFLCSDAAEWIVGQTIVADGGFLLTIDRFADREVERISFEPRGE
jgi:enoyl-[acyl-carrier protein] reductase III